MKKTLLFLLLAVTAFAGRTIPEKYESLSTLKTLTGVLQYTDIINALEQSEQVTLYEGLPHPVWQASMFREQALRDDVIWFHNIPFYSSTLALKEKDRDAIFSFLKASFPLRDELIETLVALKQCGGFHADFCLVLKTGGKEMGMMFCLGCHELIAFNEDAWLLVDIDEQPKLDALKKVLLSYASKRSE